MHPWTRHYHELYCSAEDAEKWFSLEAELELDPSSVFFKKIDRNKDIVMNYLKINLFDLFKNVK